MASLQKLSNGRWRAFVLHEGKRHSKVKDKRGEAAAWARQKEYELGLSNSDVVSKYTVKDLFARYMKEVSPNKRGERFEVLRLNALSNGALAKTLLGEVTREDMESFINLRMKSVQPSSVNRELNLISHCFTQARRWRWMTNEPMKDLQRPKDPPARDRRISDNEVELIKLALGWDGVNISTLKHRSAWALCFAIETAMRLGEICKSETTNLNLIERTLFLPHTIVKTGNSRTVPLSKESLRLIGLLGKLPSEGPFLQAKSNSLGTTFRIAVKTTTITNLTFHDSRHEAITRLADKLDVLDLARMTGHKNINELLTYYNKTAGQLAQQLD
jgi:integrase